MMLGLSRIKSFLLGGAKWVLFKSKVLYSWAKSEIFGLILELLMIFNVNKAYLLSIHHRCSGNLDCTVAIHKWRDHWIFGCNFLIFCQLTCGGTIWNFLYFSSINFKSEWRKSLLSMCSCSLRPWVSSIFFL